MSQETKSPFLVVLGIAQDAGFPQVGCSRPCCADAWLHPEKQRYPTSVAIVDPVAGQRWLFDSTPRFPEQLRGLDQVAPPTYPPPNLEGIFLTHAHVGHYAGLIYLGREALDVHRIPVHVMPRMQQFLQSQAPWNLLIRNGNVGLSPLRDNEIVTLNDHLRVKPMLVPHRGELSETVAFRIEGPSRSVLYLPDVDQWSDWTLKLEDVLSSVDVAYLDGTFYDAGEIPDRELSEIPHPFVVTTMQRLASLPRPEREKVRFVHFNHTNPALRSDSHAAKIIRAQGYGLAEQWECVTL